MHRKVSAVLASALWLAACAGGQTGDLSGEKDHPEEGTFGGGDGRDTCEDTKTPLDDLDQMTSLGFSPNEVLGFASGTFTAPLVWQHSSYVSYGPESGTGKLTLSIVPKGTAAYVASVPTRGMDGGGFLLDGAEGCAPDRIVCDVELHASTTGGALDEVLDAELTATQPDSAELDVPLELDALNGSFSIEELSPPTPIGDDPGEAEIEGLVLSSVLTSSGMTGSLSARYQATYSGGEAPAYFAAPVTFAVWPGDAARSGEVSNGAGL